MKYVTQKEIDGVWDKAINGIAKCKREILINKG